MLKKHVITGALVATFAAAAAGAQTPPATSGSPSQPGTTTTTQPGTPSGSTDTTADQSAASQRGSTTLTGCVYEEKDVPGRSPNVAEQAGILEDYILAVSDEAGASGSTTGAAGTSGSTAGTSGTMSSAAGTHAKMFKLEHADDDKLKNLVGKRVEVMGRVDAEAGDRPAGTSGSAGADQSMGPDQIELPEFEITSIREVSGDCPAKPAAR